MILGSGRPAFDLARWRASAGAALRWTCHALPPDVLFDIALDRRAP
jgi:hypothetical protein